MGPAEPPVFEGHHHTIFDLLASRGLIEPGTLQAALTEHQKTGRPFTEVLIGLGVIDQRGLLCAMAEHLGCDYADKLPETLPAEMIRLVEAGIARSYGVVPVAVDNFALTLLVADPFNPHLAGDLAFALGREVRLAMADPERVQALILQFYGEEKVFPDANGASLQ